jgi:hypothetical protein
MHVVQDSGGHAKKPMCCLFSAWLLPPVVIVQRSGAEQRASAVAMALLRAPAGRHPLYARSIIVSSMLLHPKPSTTASTKYHHPSAAKVRGVGAGRQSRACHSATGCSTLE